MKKLKLLAASAAIAVSGLAHANTAPPVFDPAYDANGNITGCSKGTIVFYGSGYFTETIYPMADGQSVAVMYGGTVWCSGGWLYTSLDESQADLRPY